VNFEQVVHSYGLIGYYRVQVGQHPILDAKHDPPIHELRLSRPFPTLQVCFDDEISLANNILIHF
jgi:hypothetical protein